MRGVVLTGHGGPDRLQYRDDLPVPSPSRDEVLLQVAACGMNNTDINTRVGWYSKLVTGGTSNGTSDHQVDGSWSGNIRFPLIQGADPVGTVVSVGSEVDDRLMGTRILVDPWLKRPTRERDTGEYLGSERDGGYAEYVAIPAANAYPIDCDLTDVELATFACSYGVAEHMLDRTDIEEGQWVLVTGASGGVGVALVQLAKMRGARVVALTSGPKVEGIRQLGADVVIDRGVRDVGGAVIETTGGVDVVADVVGGGMFPELLETIRRGGHYTTAGAVAGPIVSLDLRTLYLNDLTMHGATVYPAALFARLVSHIESGDLTPLVADTFPLQELAKAQDEFMTKRHLGAIVIDVANQTV